MKRTDHLARLSEPHDIVVIGGGATGLGVAVDAASRGYRTVLVEAYDFAQGTSSRSTKLVHGGVRYLRQGNLSLVREALLERGRLLRNAPHLVHELRFLLPAYRYLDGAYYGAGIKAYDFLAGPLGLSPISLAGRKAVEDHVPGLDVSGLRGGVLFSDAQFDDARLAMNLARTAAAHDATIVNHVRVCELLKDGGRVRGVLAVDTVAGAEYALKARVVVNATGIFTDSIRRMDDPAAAATLSVSQGTHLVVDGDFLPGHTAVLIPHTDDRRVLFMIPWHDKTLIGTTDAPVSAPEMEPRPSEGEIAFLLHHVRRYLRRTPELSDIRSVFAGHRPLLGADAKTAALSRDHRVTASPSGLVTISGGKWTTYRSMAQDTVDRAVRVGSLPPRPCVTADLPLDGADAPAGAWRELGASSADVVRYEQLFFGDLHDRLPYSRSMAAYVIEREMPVKLQDVLSRRLRALLLDARAAVECSEDVARLMASLQGHDDGWIEREVADFASLAAHYSV